MLTDNLVLFCRIYIHTVDLGWLVNALIPHINQIKVYVDDLNNEMPIASYKTHGKI